MVEVLFVVISGLVLWWFIVTPVHRLCTPHGLPDPIAFGALTVGLALNLYAVATLDGPFSSYPYCHSWRRWLSVWCG